MPAHRKTCLKQLSELRSLCHDPRHAFFSRSPRTRTSRIGPRTTTGYSFILVTEDGLRVLRSRYRGDIHHLAARPGRYG